MEFLKKLLPHASDGIVTVGSAEGVDRLEASSHVILLGYYLAMLILLGMIVFSYSSSPDLLLSWQAMYRKDQEALLSIAGEEKNLLALQGLSGKKKEIEEQLMLVEKAIPSDPRYDKVIAQLEQLASKSGIAVPQSFSWSLVPSSEISNEDLRSVEVYSYSFEVTGHYESFLVFLRSLRENQRLMDVRTIADVQMDKQGLIRAVVGLWVYHLPQ